MTRERMPTPWTSGRLDGGRGPPRLLFGRMHEDAEVEAAVFPAGGRVFCIASAGCTALRLAGRGDRVVAVDVNPAQVRYVATRARGFPAAEGAADRLLALGRRALERIGGGESSLRAFLSLDDPEEQARWWRGRIDRAPFRALLALVLNPLVLRLAYAAPFVRALPRGFARILRGRLATGFARHPNRTNPYAWRLLLGQDPQDGAPARPAPGALELCSAEAADWLERCDPGAFDGFSLSNILDGAGDDHRRRILAAVRRAAAPGAVLVVRTFAEPEDVASRDWALRDRSLIWGAVRVERADTGEPIPCSTS